MKNLFSIYAVLTVALIGCDKRPAESTHLINEKLLESGQEIGEKISIGIKDQVNALHALQSCEKRSKNPTLQCKNLLIDLTRSTAHLCGLEIQREILYKAIEHNGDVRNISFDSDEICNALTLRE